MESLKPMETISEFKYKGYFCDEAEKFFGDKVTREEREGCGVVGHFVKLANGKTSLPSKGDVFTKNEKGEISLKP